MRPVVLVRVVDRRSKSTDLRAVAKEPELLGHDAVSHCKAVA